MAESQPSGLKVLIADDHEDTRLLLRLRLEKSGYRVLEAADGEEAVEVAWRECPDIILMDLGLPKLDGLAATRCIREKPRTRDALVVALTAHVEPHYRANALTAGVNAFVTKPVDLEWLVGLLADLSGAGS
jgi:two-component system cell cycle response regulator DivK